MSDDATSKADPSDDAAPDTAAADAAAREAKRLKKEKKRQQRAVEERIDQARKDAEAQTEARVRAELGAPDRWTAYLDPRKHRVIAALALVCALALVATAVLAALFVSRNSQLDDLRTLDADKQAAETVAGDYAVRAATFNYNDLKPWSDALKKGTAQPLHARFDVAVKTLTPLLQEVQWTQTATLVAAKTVDIRADRQFVVQVFVSTRMTSTQNPTGLNTITPYTITLDRDENWLITDVAGIGGVPQDGTTVPGLGGTKGAPAPTPTP
jgi:Mce-associated membrane protein